MDRKSTNTESKNPLFVVGTKREANDLIRQGFKQENVALYKDYRKYGTDRKVIFKGTAKRLAANDLGTPVENHSTRTIFSDLEEIIKESKKVLKETKELGGNVNLGFFEATIAEAELALKTQNVALIGTAIHDLKGFIGR